jgi:hypothetical protein
MTVYGVFEGLVEPLRGQSMNACLCGDLLLLVHATCTPNDAEWSQLQDMARRTRPRALFVFAPPGCPGPTAKQRGIAAATWSGLGYQAKIALMTDSRLLRGMLTAIQWLTKQETWCFAPKDFDLACNALGIDAETKAIVCTEAFAMAREFGLSEELAYLDPTPLAKRNAS